jgi:hypothetical protein
MRGMGEPPCDVCIISVRRFFFNPKSNTLNVTILSLTMNKITRQLLFSLAGSCEDRRSVHDVVTAAAPAAIAAALQCCNAHMHLNNVTFTVNFMQYQGSNCMSHKFAGRPGERGLPNEQFDRLKLLIRTVAHRSPARTRAAALQDLSFIRTAFSRPMFSDCLTTPHYGRRRHPRAAWLLRLQTAS